MAFVAQLILFQLQCDEVIEETLDIENSHSRRKLSSDLLPNNLDFFFFLQQTPLINWKYFFQGNEKLIKIPNSKCNTNTQPHG